MEISVVIVNWEADDQLRECLHSINKTVNSLEYETFIIDNNSQTVDFEQIAEDFSHVSEFEFRSLSENRGGAAVNEVQNEISGRYVLFLGPDTILYEDTLVKLYTYAENHKNVGAVSGKLLNPDETEQLYYFRFWNFPMVFYTQTLLGQATDKFIFNYKKSEYYYNKKINIESNPQVDQPPGACLMIRQDILAQDKELVDSRFKFYFNDVDICKRIYDQNYSIHIVSDAEVTHDKASSFKKRNEIWKAVEMSNSMIRYFKKHHSKRAQAVKILLSIDYLLQPIILFLWLSITRDVPTAINNSRTRAKIFKEFIFTS